MAAEADISPSISNVKSARAWDRSIVCIVIAPFPPTVMLPLSLTFKDDDIRIQGLATVSSTQILIPTLLSAPDPDIDKPKLVVIPWLFVKACSMSIPFIVTIEPA